MKTINAVRLATASIILALGAASSAHAHVTLETREAVVNTTYKAVLRVPHGCSGEATLRLRVRIPDGIVGVRPMPKAGWTLETVVAPLAQPYTSHGREITEGVVEIIWTGELLDEHYDEFVFRGRLTDALPVNEIVYISVVQECANGAERWIEIPAAGQTSRDLRYPAPGLKILPAAGGHRH
ncbi:MAG: DUF1775 domain-containing protein [Salinarimonadaceae bacterium]|nr:MAG: DUF1775 domain-containing protein [Salinarimonadaceae bacterium]